MTNLRSLRDARSWSREELAKRAGISAKTVEKHEIGRSTDVYKSVSSALALAFGCDESELFLPSNNGLRINTPAHAHETALELQPARAEKI